MNPHSSYMVIRTLLVCLTILNHSIARLESLVFQITLWNYSNLVTIWSANHILTFLILLLFISSIGTFFVRSFILYCPSSCTYYFVFSQRDYNLLSFKYGSSWAIFIQFMVIVSSKIILYEVSLHIVPESNLFADYFTLNFCEVIPELTILTNCVCL